MNSTFSLPTGSIRGTVHLLAAACIILAAVLVRGSSPACAAGSPAVRHELSVTIDPEGQSLAVTDRITLPADAAASGKAGFYLHDGLSPRLDGAGAFLSRDGTEGYMARYTLELPEGLSTVTLSYGGVIDHDLEAVGEEYARGQQSTVGSISPAGVFLSPGTAWYPAFDAPETFSLRVDLPKDWDAVSAGERRRHSIDGERRIVVWEEPNSQRGIYLVAGSYREYISREGDFTAMVFLRQEDDALAQRYLEVTHQYVAMFGDLLGSYPYRKFALVENFWETGYGMPSFTLLGPRVIRFPFILHSSYPHEILHNWWGNGVYIDYGGGNWGEGLTAYLADHLIKEPRGDDVLHRRTTLQKYADYVLTERDLPLTGFRSRHGSVSEAVGYGKALMFFHMLRLLLGDDDFVAGLRDLYSGHLFATAAWADLRRSFEKAAGRDLVKFFSAWTEREGAPSLALTDVAIGRGNDGSRLLGKLVQVQSEDYFPLRVPIVLTYEDGGEAVVETVAMEGRETAFSFDLKGALVRLDVDPFFDVFRRLDSAEIPPALSRAFGSEKAVIVLPSGADEKLAQAYDTLAASLGRTGPGEVQVVRDSDLDSLPADSSAWILGWENRFFETVPPALDAYDIAFTEDEVRLEKTLLPKRDHSFIATGRHPAAPGETILWIALGSPEAAPGLGRKLPHYHKYSYLAFEGDEPANVAKGQWPVTDSPLVRSFTADGSTPPMARPPRRRALTELKPLFSVDEMKKTVATLSRAEYDGRGIGTPGLAKAADWIAARFAEAGLSASGEDGGSGTWLQSWDHEDDGTRYRLSNVVGIVGGSDASLGPVVLGAHYDGLGRGEGTLGADVRSGKSGMLHPGADDNASGVAVLLELARSFGPDWKPLRPVYFVAFTGEETGRLGSKHFIASLPADSPPPFAMVNLDTVGRLEGRKFLVLGGSSARDWVHIFRGAGFLAGVDLQMVSEELDASDQVSFIEAGIPAVQVSTGPSPDYHRPGDTADKVDFQGLVKAASVAREAAVYLADRKEALTAGAPSGSRPSSGDGRRRASLGTVPDFAFAGPGVRLTGTVAASPAEKAGLREGDIVTAVGDTPLSGLRDLSRVLKDLPSGTSVTVTFTRDGREMTVEALLEDR